MCLIIHKPAGVEIPATLIRSAWDDNSDGAGLMFKSEKPTVYKVMPKERPDPVSHLIDVVHHLRDVELGLHFRYRTHGPVDVANTHPYPLPSGNGWLMHNGIIPPGTLGPEYKTVADILSDTGFYVLSTLQQAPDANDESFWQLVAADVGSWNKMLVMDPEGRFVRVNDDQWEDYKGLKLSNLLSCPEYQTRNSQWWRGNRIDYSDTMPGDGYKLVPDGDGEDTALVYIGTPKHPARLTRRERKMLNACLRAGTWAPFRRMT